jgi:drug/metabolite transporter (DMT)-like permease
MYYTVLAEAGPARSAVALYLVPGFAVVYGVVLLGEPLTVPEVAGLGLVVSGSWLAASQGRPSRRRAARPRQLASS